MTYLVHRVPGRLRFKALGLRTASALAGRFQEVVAGVPTAQAEIRLGAESVIVTYDPKTVSGETVLTALANSGLISESSAIPTAPSRGLIAALGSAVGNAMVAAVVRSGEIGGPLGRPSAAVLSRRRCSFQAMAAGVR